MIKRVIIAIIAAAFVSPLAFSQVKFSRPKFQSPTPTPTPTPIATQGKPMATPGRVLLNQTPTPTPTQWRSTSVPSRTQLKPTPTPMLIQSRSTSRTQLNPTPTPAPIQWKPTSMPPRTLQKPIATPTPIPPKPTATPVPPPDVKAYLDHQVASSKDKRFHLTVNGTDLALAPFHVWAQKSTGLNGTSTCIDMRSDEGRVYDIDFVTTGAQVTNVRIHRINGELVR